MESPTHPLFVSGTIFLKMAMDSLVTKAHTTFQLLHLASALRLSARVDARSPKYTCASLNSIHHSKITRHAIAHVNTTTVSEAILNANAKRDGMAVSDSLANSNTTQGSQTLAVSSHNENGASTPVGVLT